MLCHKGRTWTLRYKKETITYGVFKKKDLNIS